MEKVFDTMENILISAYGCEPDKGSEPGAGWNWAVEVAKRHKVTVLTRANNRCSIEKELQVNPRPNMSFIYYDLPESIKKYKKGQKGVQLYYALWQIGAYRYVKRLNQQHKFSMVFAVTFGTMWLPTLMYKLNVPFVWGPLGGGEGVPEVLWPQLTKKQALIERVRKINKYICLTNPWFHSACKHASALILRTEDSLNCIPLKYRSKCSMMIETGVSQEQCDALEQLPKKVGKDFVVSGRLVGLKLVDVAIRAMAEVVKVHPEASLRIVGGGECESALKRLTQQLSLEQNVVFTGMLKKEQSVQEIKNAAALVVTSGKEGGTWVLYEAMMCKTPIICMDTSGMHILVEDDGGIKLPVADYNTMVKKFAESMLWVLEHPEQAAEMGENGYKAVRSKWTWENKGLFFEDVLGKIK